MARSCIGIRESIPLIGEPWMADGMSISPISLISAHSNMLRLEISLSISEKLGTHSLFYGLESREGWSIFGSNCIYIMYEKHCRYLSFTASRAVD